MPVTDDLPPITRLEPVFELEGERLALHTAELAAVPAGMVSGTPAADLTLEHDRIRRALDLLFTGF